MPKIPKSSLRMSVPSMQHMRFGGGSFPSMASGTRIPRSSVVMRALPEHKNAEDMDF